VIPALSRTAADGRPAFLFRVPVFAAEASAERPCTAGPAGITGLSSVVSSIIPSGASGPRAKQL
jgi:hypothetical protein